MVVATIGGKLVSVAISNATGAEKNKFIKKYTPSGKIVILNTIKRYTCGFNSIENTGLYASNAPKYNNAR